ncbi:MAG: HAD family hydrolase [Thermomicrobiales bacterium]|nr:HAD family hydrolase [Thermomicrobiales bacterium]MCO5220353.1 HAD family hydrolase [Thermomicrobiales bacterium]
MMKSGTLRSYRIERQTLLIDADDTLWHNNIHFERTTNAFIDYLGHSRLSRDEVRQVVNEVERANLKTNGYGTESYTANLIEAYRRLSEREIDQRALDEVFNIGMQILDAEIELLHGVSETLEDLSTRHELVLFTKGNPNEQRSKIERSGVKQHFKHIDIVTEKDVTAYVEVVRTVGAIADLTWMVGNSPRSDINPAIDAGLGAVFIPYEFTWEIEIEEISLPSGRFLQLDEFPQLLEYF